MKRIIIVVEGQTEQEFVKQCIAPYLLAQHGILSISARLIGKPGYKGGNVRYDRLKTDLSILLGEGNVVVSTFIDFFRLANDFPNHVDCLRYTASNDKIACLEEQLGNAINDPRFIPYIQCHEFEALLFSSRNGFDKYFSLKTCEQLAEVSKSYPNPEHINNTQPPSYRLIEIVSRYEGFKYDKVTYGNILALEIGIDTMLVACPRFANWIRNLVLAASL